MQKAIKHDDDRDLALSALIEGEATLTMIGAQMERLGRLEDRRRCPPPDLDRVFSLMMPADADGRRRRACARPRRSSPNR